MNAVKADPNIPLRTEKELEDIGAVLTENGYRLPAYEFATLEEFIKEIGGRPELTKAYQEFIQQLTSFEANENFGLPDPMEVNLKNHGFIMRPYQRSGIHWLNWLRANHLHGVLADDMGLGKTLKSLCALRLGYEQTKTQQHSLVIAPKSVLIQWEREIKRVYPEMRLYIYHGSNRTTDIFRSSLPFIIITTYDMVVRDLDEFSKIPFYYLILDEATGLKILMLNAHKRLKR